MNVFHYSSKLVVPFSVFRVINLCKRRIAYAFVLILIAKIKENDDLWICSIKRKRKNTGKKSTYFNWKKETDGKLYKKWRKVLFCTSLISWKWKSIKTF
jgi:hypothetical protein